VTGVAVVYGTKAGVGGLGLQVENAVTDWADAAEAVTAIGPGIAPGVAASDRITWREVASPARLFVSRNTWLRWLAGRRQLLNDRSIGGAAAVVVAEVRPRLVYAFTQIALESLRWANAAKVPSVLESPNGHLCNFRDVYRRETRRFGGRVYLGHPSAAMVARVEEEYARADVIRVSSEWAKSSLIAGGVPGAKVVVIGQRPTALGFRPTKNHLPPIGPLRVCCVATLDLRKGFVYLLRAVRRLGPDRVTVRLVGGTVDRFTRQVLARERVGLNVEAAPAHPLAALHWAELFVLPTLEDGSPFAVVEAMAAGVPLVVTDACGNAPLVRPGETGWVVPAGDDLALARALDEAIARRQDLLSMGARARAAWEQLATESPAQSLRELLARLCPGIGRRQRSHCHNTPGLVEEPRANTLRQ
jgi:glycosyltransferase involved in cell wall biosynthesis